MPLQDQTVKVNTEEQSSGIQQNNVKVDIGVTEGTTPQIEKEVEDTTTIFVPFEDFTGRINQTDFNFRKDIPTKVPKTEANVWLEAKKGYIK